MGRGAGGTLITVAGNFKALQWLRGPKCDVRPELAAILSSSSSRPPTKSMPPRAEEEDGMVAEEDEGVEGEGRRRHSPLSDFSQPECYLPLLILVGTFFLQQGGNLIKSFQRSKWPQNWPENQPEVPLEKDTSINFQFWVFLANFQATF